GQCARRPLPEGHLRVRHWMLVTEAPFVSICFSAALALDGAPARQLVATANVARARIRRPAHRRGAAERQACPAAACARARVDRAAVLLPERGARAHRSLARRDRPQAADGCAYGLPGRGGTCASRPGADGAGR